MMNLHRIELDVYAANARADMSTRRSASSSKSPNARPVYKFGQYHDVDVMGLLEGELL